MIVRKNEFHVRPTLLISGGGGNTRWLWLAVPVALAVDNIKRVVW